MVEARAVIKNIQETRKALENLGATFNSSYSFNDIIFVPKKEYYNLNEDFLRARCYIKNNWPTKKVVLTRKQTNIGQVSKTNQILFRKEFDSEKEVFDFVGKQFGQEFRFGFEYEREGWQYDFEECHMFVENIQEYMLSIEIEATSEEKLESLFQRIEITETVKDSLPETMKKILKPS